MVASVANGPDHFAPEIDTSPVVDLMVTVRDWLLNASVMIRSAASNGLP